MKEIVAGNKCCGCNLCATVCPMHCIVMKEDVEGFLHPIIDQKKCIECGKCKKACPVNCLSIPVHDEIRNAFAAVHSDEKIRLTSSSGGVFTAIAEKVIDHGGVVFGAAFNNSFEVVHKYTEDKEGLKQFRGSKYVQSVVGDAYKDVLKFLKEGRLVLFSGTPCQIAALKSFLPNKGKYENLILVDLICHGVPSPGLWRKYLEYRNSLDGSDLVSEISFRNKEISNDPRARYNIKFIYKDGVEYMASNNEDPYSKAFQGNISLRPACYHCLFRTKDRPSDITLGDFWWIENILPTANDGKGVSLVTVHSVRGQNLLDSVCEKNGICLTKVDYEKAIGGNPGMTEKIFRTRKRKKFYRKIMHGEDFSAVATKLSQRSKLRIKLGRMYRRLKKLKFSSALR